MFSARGRIVRRYSGHYTRPSPDLPPLFTDVSPQLDDIFGGVGALATFTGSRLDTSGILRIEYSLAVYRSILWVMIIMPSVLTKTNANTQLAGKAKNPLTCRVSSVRPP